MERIFHGLMIVTLYGMAPSNDTNCMKRGEGGGTLQKSGAKAKILK